jgi:hypothetical protein
MINLPFSEIWKMCDQRAGVRRYAVGGVRGNGRFITGTGAIPAASGDIPVREFKKYPPVFKKYAGCPVTGSPDSEAWGAAGSVL